MGTLRPDGEDPFNLNLAQQARASKNGDLIDLTFYVSFTGGPPQKVCVELTQDTAVTLLGELKAALT
jgi:hypothetical protein